RRAIGGHFLFPKIKAGLLSGSGLAPGSLAHGCLPSVQVPIVEGERESIAGFDRSVEALLLFFRFIEWGATIARPSLNHVVGLQIVHAELLHGNVSVFIIHCRAMARNFKLHLPFA